MRKKKLWCYLIALFAGLMISAYSYCAYWILYPFEVVTFDKIEVLNETIHPGDVIEYRITGTKHMALPAKVIQQVVNQRVEVYAPFGLNLPTGAFDKILKVKISKYSEPGIHYLCLTVIYHIHPLRTKIYTLQSKPFIISPCGDNKPKQEIELYQDQQIKEFGQNNLFSSIFEIVYDNIEVVRRGFFR